ncbi:UNVERIFIED_CONTAM: hypothetical protein GTU68_062108 [Idotea baltica]|nr:hypothetical protein [Idotea baltica]
MLKIGVGPSSSHTLGPWKAALDFRNELLQTNTINSSTKLNVHLFGSLALTGKGHATDKAILLGLAGLDPETYPTQNIDGFIDSIATKKVLALSEDKFILFNPSVNIIFHIDRSLAFHANGMQFEWSNNHISDKMSYYSTGGGFIVKGEVEQNTTKSKIQLPYPCDCSADLYQHCIKNNLSIAQMVHANELAWQDAEAISKRLKQIWKVMKNGVYKGCHTRGELPGGLQVSRRAASLYQKLIVRNTKVNFTETSNWISCFALAINEENANMGRVVTAPTNGAAGVIPAVLMYYLCFHNHQAGIAEAQKFLMIAGEIGSFFQKKATISAAMGGCQAEIGVSSSMAAAALCELCGGTVAQAMMAAEIAMEHHLGLTCDPVGGLVQIPCIERNAMGAIKAITASELALNSDPSKAKVSLDEVIETMWATAQDMHSKYNS